MAEEDQAAFPATGEVSCLGRKCATRGPLGTPKLNPDAQVNVADSISMRADLMGIRIQVHEHGTFLGSVGSILGRVPSYTSAPTASIQPAPLKSCYESRVRYSNKVQSATPESKPLALQCNLGRVPGYFPHSLQVGARFPKR